MTPNPPMPSTENEISISGRYIVPPIIKEHGPVVVFIGGIHGNEPAGVLALKQLLLELGDISDKVLGSVYGLVGNKAALREGKRFNEVDLNRIWTAEAVEQSNSDGIFENEYKEQLELWACLNQIVERHDGPFYFLDLHTTSAPTVPFMTVNDSLLNRSFTSNYPLPVVLGIEEYLEGPLLSYINSLGYVAFGFEAGQHEDQLSVQNCYDFAVLSLRITGILEEKTCDCSKHRARLGEQTDKLEQFYEITYRHAIRDRESFDLRPGYKNFQVIEAGEILGYEGKQILITETDTQLFMPLYQGQGEDGYFLIQPIPKFFLRLSKWLRKYRLDRLLPLLPGVYWKDPSKAQLRVNLRIARFLTVPLLHLFGYRKKDHGESELLITNREAASRTADYKKAPWY